MRVQRSRNNCAQGGEPGNEASHVVLYQFNWDYSNRTGQRGETLRCIIGKAISITLKYDIQVTVGPLQLCAGFKGGCEAAEHYMQQLFSLPQFDAVIQVDACNAFNFLNRQTALRNILHLCPPLAKVLINTYRVDTNLYVKGESILSQEGTTQGGPLAMAMFAISTTPLIHRPMTEDIKQAWFADDASAAAWRSSCTATMVGPSDSDRARVWMLSQCSQDLADS